MRYILMIVLSFIIFSCAPSEEPLDKAIDEVVIITLNMHTYQEANQDAKFDIIAHAIWYYQADFVALQECAQDMSSTIVDNIGGANIRNDNMALILQERLKTDYQLDYYYNWAWAHYGFGYYEEGVAVMSLYPLTDLTNIWISTSHSASDLASRKAVSGSCFVSRINQHVHFISAHFQPMSSISDTEPKNQVIRLKNLVESNYTAGNLVLVCGDYNNQPTESDPRWSSTYLNMRTNSIVYTDTFLVDNPTANNLPENSIFDTVKGTYPGRIDYIFMRTNSNYRVISSDIIFTSDNLGLVSDHFGVVTRIKKQ